MGAGVEVTKEDAEAGEARVTTASALNAPPMGGAKEEMMQAMEEGEEEGVTGVVAAEAAAGWLLVL